MIIKQVHAIVNNGTKLSPEGDRLIDDNEYYTFKVRSISRKEYKDWKTITLDRSFDFEDKVLENAVLECPAYFMGKGWDWDDVYAGIPSQIVDAVLSISGFSEDGPPQEALDQASEYLNSNNAKYDLIILLATDAYKLSDIESLHPEEWHCVVGQAYNKLKSLGINPDDIINGGASKGSNEKLQEAARTAEEYSQNIMGNRSDRPNVRHSKVVEFSQTWGGDG